MAGLSGDYSFEDTKSGDLITSFLSIDTGLGQLCLANQVQDFDRLAVPFNRSVTFSYSSQGSITKENDNRVNGEFPPTVSLRLVIINLVPGEPETEYDETMTVGCKLEASLRKEGDRDKVKLLCDLGENLSQFGLTPALIQNVANAYGPGKQVRVRTKKGKLKIPHTGDLTEGGPISCSLNED